MFRRHRDENIQLYAYDVTSFHAKRLRGFGPVEDSFIEAEANTVIMTAEIITSRRLQLI